MVLEMRTASIPMDYRQLKPLAKQNPSSSSPNSHQEEHDASQPRKRRKIALACDQCRTRKSRCDGVKPICSKCSQRGNRPEHCRYTSNVVKDPDQDEYVQSLLERIQDLERHQTSHWDAQNANSSNQDGRAADFTPPSQSKSQHSAHTVASNAAARSEPMPQGVSPVDAMGANSTLELDEQEDGDRYYGSSSAVSFMQQVYKTILHGLPSAGANSPGRHTASRPPQQAGKEKFWALRDMAQLSLLPRPLMDNVLDCYWERIYHLYPFVHRPTFMRAYEQLWEANPRGDRLGPPEAGLGGSVEYGPHSVVFHCALNMMLALATEFMDTPLEDRRRLGESFARKAKDLCQLDLFDDGSLPVIQTLLLMTQYLQSTPWPNKCWNCIGITCRLAQGLGLYVENAHAMQRSSPLEIEMRRRVWHGCVILDAIVSMTLGRPLMLYRYQQIPLPGAIDDEYLASPETQPASQVSYMHFYVQTIKLYSMLADVVAQMYANTATKSVADSLGGTNNDRTTGAGFGSFAFIQEMDAAISEFEEQIPHHLHWMRRESLPTHIKSVRVFEQQSSVLHVRFLHLKILLYRPAFIRYCQQICAQEASRTGPGPLHRATEVSLIVARGLSTACIESSIALIDQVHARSTTTATGAWWYNLFYARTAGIVVLLAMVGRDSTAADPISRHALGDAWTKCQAALAALQVFSPSVVRCLRGLERLHQHVLNYMQTSSSSASASPRIDHTDGRNVLSIATGERGAGPQVLEGGGLEQSFMPLAQDLFGDLSEFGWPNGLEASMLDDIFSFDVLTQ